MKVSFKQKNDAFNLSKSKIPNLEKLFKIPKLLGLPSYPFCVQAHPKKILIHNVYDNWTNDFYVWKIDPILKAQWKCLNFLIIASSLHTDFPTI